MLLTIIAPWIVDSWREALLALSFDIPVLKLAAYERHLAMAAIALLLLAVFWHSVALVPARARWASRLLMSVVLAGPAAAFVAVHMETIASLPKFSGRVRVAAPTQTAQATPFTIKPQPLPATVPLNETKLAALSSPVMETKAEPTTQPSHPSVTLSIEPPAAAPDAPASPTEAATASVKRGLRSLQKLLPTASPSDLIPVYYGTDRAAETQSARLDYTSARAERLELGRAFVSVPNRSASTRRRPIAAVSPEITVQHIPGHDLATQFTIQDIHAFSATSLAEQTSLQMQAADTFKDEALIFVPGFNTSFDAGLFRTAQIVADLDFDGVAFVYSWPSAGRVAEYAYDRDSAEAASASFNEFVRFVMKQSGAKTVNVIAHGLGARLTLRALATFKNDVPTVKLGELMFAAPDVDRMAFAAQIAPLVDLARRTTLYVASTDRSLNISRRYAGLVPRAGDVLDTGPLVLPGIDTIDVSAPGTDTVGLNHAAYVTPSALARDMASRLTKPVANAPALQEAISPERVATPKGDYHRYVLNKVSER